MILDCRPVEIADHPRVATAQCQSFETLHVSTTTIGAPKFGETSNDPPARFRPAGDLRAPDIEATVFLLEMLGRRPWLGNTACPIASRRVRRTARCANIQIQACNQPRSGAQKTRGDYTRRHSVRQLGRCCTNLQLNVVVSIDVLRSSCRTAAH